MKQGEAFLAFTEKYKINVSSIGRALNMKRGAVYNLFKTKSFQEATFDKIATAYPDFPEYFKTQVDNVSPTTSDIDTLNLNGYKNTPSIITEAKRDELLILMASQLSFLVEEKRNQKKYSKDESNQLMHEHLKKVEAFLIS